MNNKKGQIDIMGFEVQPIPLLLAVVGFCVAYFTAAGGISSSFGVSTWHPSIFIKLASGILGGIAGYVIGIYKYSD